MKFVTILTLLLSWSALCGQESDYYGFRCLDFTFEGRDAKIVFPEKAEEGRHWIWRARFWGHEPQTEVALLKKGFHVVYVDAADLRGNPEAVKLWDRFYAYLLKTYVLNPRTVLEGFSRGGLYIYNWGSANPEKVACIYADAPVCDLRSWPGRKKEGKQENPEWAEHLKAYNLTEETVDEFKGMPIYNCVKLAQAHVPVLHVCGSIDEVVPVEENTYVLEKNFKAAGGDITIIVKEGIGHHPHSLRNPAPIVRFILSHTAPALLDPPIPVDSLMSINLRSTMDNCRVMFEQNRKGRVAFLGGSITTNPGWRTMVCDYLQKRFPNTSFDFIPAGIPSMGSPPHAMRFSRDVLAKGKVDLLFVEAAVNDATNDVPPKRQLRGMEGIVVQALRSNPKMDIVMLHFADLDRMADYNNGKVPVVIQQHEKVAEHYGVNSIDLAREVNDRILNGEFSWRDDFKDLNPSPFGQELYFRTITHLLEKCWDDGAETQASASTRPARFFAMDTAIRDLHSLDTVRSLGYDGISWKAGPYGDMVAAVEEVRRHGLTLFAVYSHQYTVLTKGGLDPDPYLDSTMQALKGSGALVWLPINSEAFPPGSPEGDSIAVPRLRQLADRAAELGLRVAIYPHMHSWTERLQDAVRLARKVDRPNFGVTFNLCHSLMAGDEAKIPALLEEAGPYLFMVTINGADSAAAGTTWSRLIRPLDEGSYDVRGVLDRLRELRYAGPIGLQGYGVQIPANENLTRSMRAWRHLIEKR